MAPFVQVPEGRCTLDYWRELLAEKDPEIIAAFAYITDSGAAQMQSLRQCFQGIQRCRWIFGVDYGRSHPTAIRKMSELTTYGEIRIHDGDHVVNATDFRPRVSFHLKTVMTQDSSGRASKQLVGSANLSATGLTTGIEAGCFVDLATVSPENGEGVAATLERLWEASVPFGEVIDEYERLWKIASKPTVSSAGEGQGRRKLFWVDVGYVTENRGEDRPGNQFDLPIGSHVHLGLPRVSAPAKNSVLGELNMRTPNGEVVSRNLRHGNNSMEKLTLPIPETHGYGSYDGKILTFEKKDAIWVLESFEHDDFERQFGRHIDSCNQMKSGRYSGTISI